MLVLANCQRARSRLTGVSLPSLRTASASPARPGVAGLRHGFGWPVVHPLLPPQAGVAAAGGQELVVGAAFDDPSLVEHDDLVHLLQPGQAGG